MKSEPNDRSERFTEDAQVDGAIKRAAKEAILDHKRRGAWIAVWKDGKVVHLAAEEIPDDAERE